MRAQHTRCFVCDKLAGPWGFLTVLQMARRLRRGRSLCMMGPVCSSWVWINRGTSQRSDFNVLGNEACASGHYSVCLKHMCMRAHAQAAGTLMTGGPHSADRQQNGVKVRSPHQIFGGPTGDMGGSLS